MTTSNTSFHWERQPKAEQLILAFLEQAVDSNPVIAQLQQDLLIKTSTRLFDWLDHIIVLPSVELTQQLQEAGFVQQESFQDPVYYHPGAQLPRIVIQPSSSYPSGLAVAVDHIADFLMTRGGRSQQVEGSIFGNYRRCLVHTENQTALWVVERRGTLTLEPTQESSESIERYMQALERWQMRARDLQNDDQAMQEALDLAKDLVDEVGQHRAAWTVLEGERRYWQSRNTAGQIQKNRQDRLGMGWSNHDHHTFRSSRRHFHQLVHLFEILGFHCRERYYAGQEAGWGAQIMENPVCRLVLFLDVDLAPDEIAGDIAHEPLPPLPKLGTIGLWCALHGDSILKAGMHHLEAQFMFEELTQDLAQMGIKMMNPFSSFPYLKQAFTVGEMWQVDPRRIRELLQAKHLSDEHADKFLTQGALGSHLENLQRREGYKGFNQKNVSSIIKKTDPRLSEHTKE